MTEKEWYSFPVMRERAHIRNITLANGFDVPRWKWLAWVLRKLRLLNTSVYQHYYDTYTRVDIKHQDLVEVIHQALGERAMFNRPHTLYVSNEVYHELIRVFDRELLVQPMTYPVTIWGMRIIFTPYLNQGILPVWEEDL